jgi:hypothetical protein
LTSCRLQHVSLESKGQETPPGPLSEIGAAYEIVQDRVRVYALQGNLIIEVDAARKVQDYVVVRRIANNSQDVVVRGIEARHGKGLETS